MNDLKLYNSFREELNSGDLLLWKSHSVLGWLIRKFSRGNVNHAGLVIRLDQFSGLTDRRWTLEALGNGIMLNLLSRRLLEYDGRVYWYSLNPEYDSLRTKISEWAIEKSGVPYDYGSLFKNALGRVSADAKKFFCSEYCYMAYKESGIEFEFKKAPRPADMPLLGIFEEPVRIF
jgi:uncharacterized protein YycO